MRDENTKWTTDQNPYDVLSTVCEADGKGKGSEGPTEYRILFDPPWTVTKGGQINGGGGGFPQSVCLPAFSFRLVSHIWISCCFFFLERYHNRYFPPSFIQSSLFFLASLPSAAYGSLKGEAKMKKKMGSIKEST